MQAEILEAKVSAVVARAYRIGQLQELPGNECWRWATLACMTLRMAGCRAIMQAGSARFPMYARADAPDTESTHFSYEWELSPRTLDRVRCRLLPEMHVWCALPDLGAVVDCTVGFQQANALAMGIERKWTSKLPDIFIGGAEAAGDLWLSYVADQAAIELLAALRNGEGREIEAWLSAHR